MSRINDLKDAANAVGVALDSYNPGGVATRYRFFSANEPCHDYFAIGSNRAYATVLGIADAETWLSGFVQGYYAGREEGE